jgi:protocatechuate 3,4-dioxygenase beta subunit
MADDHDDGVRCPAGGDAMSDNPHDPVPFRPHVAGTQPAYDSPAYLSTRKRHPGQPLVRPPHTITEVTGPRFTPAQFPACVDMSKNDGHEAVGERIIVEGLVVDEDGRPVPDTMIELWQANAAGRYAHERDQHDAPLDGKFRGTGRVFTDGSGRYRFTSIKPGAYPWRNHHNAWRPNHIHYSLFGPGFATRLITQMYFPGDPLLPLDPIFNCIPDAAARERLIARFDLSITQPEYALGYRFDVVLPGRGATPFEAN